MVWRGTARWRGRAWVRSENMGIGGVGNIGCKSCDLGGYVLLEEGDQ